jgi:hypothetical protein
VSGGGLNCLGLGGFGVLLDFEYFLEALTPFEELFFFDEVLVAVDFLVLVFYVRVGLLFLLRFFVRGLAELEFGAFEVEFVGLFGRG